MSTSNKKPVKSKKKELLDSYSELVEITGGMRESAYQIIASNAKVIQGLPVVLDDMKHKNTGSSEVKKVLAVARTIAKDTDSFTRELKEIDGKFVDIKSKGVKDFKVATKNYTNVLALSTRYMDITTRLTETTGSLVDDFTDLCLSNNETVNSETREDKVDE